MMINQWGRSKVRQIRNSLYDGSMTDHHRRIVITRIREGLYNAGLPVYMIDKWIAPRNR